MRKITLKNYLLIPLLTLMTWQVSADESAARQLPMAGQSLSRFLDTYPEVKQQVINDERFTDFAARVSDPSNTEIVNSKQDMKVIKTKDYEDLEEYVSFSGHIGINYLLRENPGVCDNRCPGIVRALAALRKYKGVVFRGMSVREKDSRRNRYLTAGSIIQEPAFVSAARKENGFFYANETDTLTFVIQSKTGANIEAAVSKLSSEVLFMPGTSFRIDLVVPREQNRYVVFMTELD